MDIIFIVYVHNGNGWKTKLKSFRTFKSAEKYAIKWHILDNNDHSRTFGKHVNNWDESMVGDTFIETI